MSIVKTRSLLLFFNPKERYHFESLVEGHISTMSNAIREFKDKIIQDKKPRKLVEGMIYEIREK